MSNRRRYSPELKNEAINMVLLQGLVQEEVAKMLSIPSGTLANWIIRYKAKGAKTKPGDISPVEMAAENSRLRKELTQAKMERDILKKAIAYFAKEPM